MKKIFIITVLSFLSLTMLIRADIKYDSMYDRFYSMPMTSDIDQDEYHCLMVQVSIITIQCYNSGVYGKKVVQQITSYLKILNTPTSLRLLYDLNKES